MTFKTGQRDTELVPHDKLSGMLILCSARKRVHNGAPVQVWRRGGRDGASPGKTLLKALISGRDEAKQKSRGPIRRKRGEGRRAEVPLDRHSAG